jgi:hypothetical protein
MSHPQTNFDVDPYDDDIYALSRAEPVRVIDIGEKTRNEAPEYGSWQSVSVPLLGGTAPFAQLLQRRLLRYRARLYLPSQDMLASSAGSGSTGVVTDPGAGATITNINGLTAGTYQITATAYVTGTVQAADQDNMKLVESSGFVTLAKLIVPPVSGVIGPPVTFTLNIPVGTTTNILIATNAAGSNAAVVYAGSLIITQIAGPETVYIASNPALLINPSGEGAYPVPLNTFIDWYSQQPCYAVATGATANINVNDESWDSASKASK